MTSASSRWRASPVGAVTGGCIAQAELGAAGPASITSATPTHCLSVHRVGGSRCFAKIALVILVGAAETERFAKRNLTHGSQWRGRGCSMAQSLPERRAAAMCSLTQAAAAAKDTRRACPSARDRPGLPAVAHSLVCASLRAACAVFLVSFLRPSTPSHRSTTDRLGRRLPTLVRCPNWRCASVRHGTPKEASVGPPLFGFSNRGSQLEHLSGLDPESHVVSPCVWLAVKAAVIAARTAAFTWLDQHHHKDGTRKIAARAPPGPTGASLTASGPVFRALLRQ